MKVKQLRTKGKDRMELKTESEMIRKGDKYIGHCMACGSVCLCERLSNGHDNDMALYTNIAKARPLAEAMVKRGEAGGSGLLIGDKS